jgi:hypothetical protein
MKCEGLIGTRTVQSTEKYIVFSDEKGVVASCRNLKRARNAFEIEQAASKQWGIEPHLSIFHWSGAKWKPAVSLYQLQEAELERNPTQRTQYV